MIYISKNIYIDESAIKFKGIRSSKPGGQNVNKVSSGIHLQYDLNDYNYPAWFMKNINRIGKKNISTANIETVLVPDTMALVDTGTSLLSLPAQIFDALILNILQTI